VRSARPPLFAAGAALVLVGLSGCVTTQDRNARAKLRATRLLTSRGPLIVTRRNLDVRVDDVALLRSAGATAIVVRLANTSAKTLTDLPISVGVVARGRRTYLNRRAGLEYFQRHVAAIGARGVVTWVFTTRRPTAAGIRPFALVGEPVRPPVSHAGSLPGIVASALAVPAATASGGVRVRVRNPTQVPQYGLVIYALARRGDRYVAAGRATVDDLGTNSAATVELKLIGSPRRAPLELKVPPTIFR
jgi:hypothetical protein